MFHESAALALWILPPLPLVFASPGGSRAACAPSRMRRPGGLLRALGARAGEPRRDPHDPGAHPGGRRDPALRGGERPLRPAQSRAGGDRLAARRLDARPGCAVHPHDPDGGRPAGADRRAQPRRLHRLSLVPRHAAVAGARGRQRREPLPARLRRLRSALRAARHAARDRRPARAGSAARDRGPDRAGARQRAATRAPRVPRSRTCRSTSPQASWSESWAASAPGSRRCCACWCDCSSPAGVRSARRHRARAPPARRPALARRAGAAGSLPVLREPARERGLRRRPARAGRGARGGRGRRSVGHARAPFPRASRRGWANAASPSPAGRSSA